MYIENDGNLGIVGGTLLAPLGKFWAKRLAPKVAVRKAPAVIRPVPKFDLGTPVLAAPKFNLGTPLVKPLAFDLGVRPTVTTYPAPRPKPAIPISVSVSAPVAPTISPRPAPIKAGLGQFAMPAMIGGAVLLIAMMAGGKKGKR